MQPVLELRNATLLRGGARVLDGLSLAIQQGEHTAILGPNGAGKSSLIRLLTFEDRPHIGENGSAPMRIFGPLCARTLLDLGAEHADFRLERIRGQPVSLLAVDFVGQGDVEGAADELNGVG